MTLFEPDAFRDDWYGELTNQMGHALLGIILSAGFCLTYNALAGEMPHRVLALVVVGLPYPVFWEWLRQGCTPGDSYFDSAMYICGVLGPLVAFREIEPGLIEPQAGPFFTLLTVWAFALFIRVRKRR